MTRKESNITALCSDIVTMVQEGNTKNLLSDQKEIQGLDIQINYLYRPRVSLFNMTVHHDKIAEISIGGIKVVSISATYPDEKQLVIPFLLGLKLQPTHTEKLNVVTH